MFDGWEEREEKKNKIIINKKVEKEEEEENTEKGKTLRSSRKNSNKILFHDRRSRNCKEETLSPEECTRQRDAGMHIGQWDGSG